MNFMKFENNNNNKKKTENKLLSSWKILLTAKESI